MSPEDLIRAACLVEVTARKPGNVHPLAAFADCDWESFAASADAIAPVLAAAPARPLGETILAAVEATRRVAAANTNLGMILLLAPLAAVPPDRRLSPSSVDEVVLGATREDCGRIYEAIRLASPGGLGRAESQDVSAPPDVPLSRAMELAADRDDVAKQYVTGFADVFTLSCGFTAADLPGLECQIVDAHVHRLAAASDTLIARKCGTEVAAEARRLACDAVDAGGLETAAGRERVAALDAFLRADGNRRNPGTTADLIAAALYVASRDGVARAPAAAEVAAYADELRRFGRSVWDAGGPR